MIGFQANRRWLRPGVSTSTLIAVAVCLTLLALISMVQVTHLHQTATEADHCALCAVMHSVTPVALAAAAVLLVQLGVAAQVVVTRAPVRRWKSRHFTRPPPQSW
jgi:hypothetical protein